MIFSIEYVILVARDHNNTVVTLFWKTYVNLIVIHDASYILSSETNKSAVNAWIDIYLLTVLIILCKTNPLHLYSHIIDLYHS